MDSDEDAQLLDQLTQVLAQKSDHQNQVNQEAAEETRKDYSHLIKPCHVKIQKLSLKDVEQLQANLCKERPGISSLRSQENTGRQRTSPLLRDIKQENTGRQSPRSKPQAEQSPVPGRRSSRTSSLVSSESIRLLLQGTDRSRSGSPSSLRSKNARKLVSESEKSESRASSRSSSRSGQQTRQRNERSNSRESSRSSSKNYRAEPEEPKSKPSTKKKPSWGPVKLNTPKKRGGTSKKPAGKRTPATVTKIKIEAEESDSSCHEANNMEKYAHLKLLQPVIKLIRIDLATLQPKVTQSSETVVKIDPKSKMGFIETESEILQEPSTSGFVKKVKIGPKSKMSQVEESDSESEFPMDVEEYASDDECTIKPPSEDSKLAKSTSNTKESTSRDAKSTVKRPKIGPKSKISSGAGEESGSESTSSIAKSTVKRPKIGPKSKISSGAGEESGNESTSSIAKSTVKRPKIGPKSKISSGAGEESGSESTSSIAKSTVKRPKIGPKSKISSGAGEESGSESTSSIAKSTVKRPKIGPKSKISSGAGEESGSESTSSIAKSTVKRPKIGPKSKMARLQVQQSRQLIEESDDDVEQSDLQISSAAKTKKSKIGPKSKMARIEVQQLTDGSDVDIEQIDDSVIGLAASVAKPALRKHKIGPKSKTARNEQLTDGSDVDIEQIDDPVIGLAASVAKPAPTKSNIGPKSKTARNEQLTDGSDVDIEHIDDDSVIGLAASVVKPAPTKSNIGTNARNVIQEPQQLSKEDDVEQSEVAAKLRQKRAKIGPKSKASQHQVTESRRSKEVESDSESIICLDTEAAMDVDLQITLKRVREEFDADPGPSRKRAKCAPEQKTAKSVNISPIVQQSGAGSASVTKRCSVSLDRTEVSRYLQKCGPKKNNDEASLFHNLLCPAAENTSLSSSHAPSTLTSNPEPLNVSTTLPNATPKLSCVNLSLLKEPSAQSNVVVPRSQLNPKNIMCVFCCKRFPNAAVLQHHLTVSHPLAVTVTNGKFFCHRCKNNLTSKVAFKKHEASCSRIVAISTTQFQQARPHVSQSPPEMLQPSPPFNAQVPILCDVCGLNLPDTLSLSRHKMEAHSFGCDKCTMKFSCVQGLESHRAEMHGHSTQQAPILCELCGLSLPDSIALSAHKMESHSFGCTKCALNLSSLDSLQNHKVEKHGYHKCPSCHLDFPNFDLLLQHVATTQHTNGTLLNCEACQIKFTRPEFLIRHNAVRHNKGYFCMKCLEVFGDITKMLSHYEKCKKKIVNVLQFADGNEELNKSRKFVCDHCSFKCASWANLSIHKESFHGAQLECPHCKLFFTTWGQHDVELCKSNILRAKAARVRSLVNVIKDALGMPQNKSTEPMQQGSTRRGNQQQQSTPGQSQQGKTYMILPPTPVAREKPQQQQPQRTYQRSPPNIPGTYIRLKKPSPLKRSTVMPAGCHKCEQCNLVFPNPEALVVHNMSHRIMNDVMSGTFHCKYCNEEYENITHLTLHLKACWKNPKWNQYDGTGETTQEFAEVKLENYLSDEDTMSASEFERTPESVETVEPTSQVHLIHTYFKCIHCLRLFERSELLQEHLSLPPEESVDKYMVMLTNDILNKLLGHFQAKGKPLQLQMQQNSQNPPQTIRCGNCKFKTSFECDMITHCKTCSPRQVSPIEVLNLDEELMGESMETEDSDPLFSNKTSSNGPTIVECHSEMSAEPNTEPANKESPCISEQPEVHRIHSVSSDSEDEIQPSSDTLPPADSSEQVLDTQTSGNDEIQLLTDSPESSKQLEIQNKESSGDDVVMTEILPLDNLSPESSKQLEDKQSSEISLPVESSETQVNVTSSILASSSISTQVQASSIENSAKVQDAAGSDSTKLQQNASPTSSELNPDIEGEPDCAMQEDSGTRDTEREPNSAKEGSDASVFEKIAEECTNSILQIQEKSMSSNSYGDELPLQTCASIDVDESAVFSHDDASIPYTTFNFHPPTAVAWSDEPTTQSKHWDFAAPLANR